MSWQKITYKVQKLTQTWYESNLEIHFYKTKYSTLKYECLSCGASPR